MIFNVAVLFKILLKLNYGGRKNQLNNLRLILVDDAIKAIYFCYII